MKIFKDIFSGDELFSDSYPIREIDDIVYEVTGKFIVEKEGDYGITANKEEDDESEGAAAGFEATEKRVIDIVSAHRLSETSFDKKSYMAYIKTYMQRLKKHLEEKNPSRVNAFQTAAQNFVKKVLSNFDNYSLGSLKLSYMGAAMDLDAMIPLLSYKEDGVTPVFYFWKDGVVEEKY